MLYQTSRRGKGRILPLVAILPQVGACGWADQATWWGGSVRPQDRDPRGGAGPAVLSPAYLISLLRLPQSRRGAALHPARLHTSGRLRSIAPLKRRV